VVEAVRRRGLLRLAEPITLRSGQLSAEFVDVKAALAQGQDLETACRALLEGLAGVLATEPAAAFDAVGGLTMGADPLAHVLAVLTRRSWFVVRKEPKGRGTDRLIEGERIGPGSRVLLVEDTVTTGGSILRAHTVVSGTGATVVAAAAVVDRGDAAGRVFADLGVPYLAVVTYRDLGIDPVGPPSS
jgi:orotate phosphoribosyltransferase